MVREIKAQRYYVSCKIRMLDQEVQDFYIIGLADGRLEAYEPPISEFLLRYASLIDSQPWSFLDIGANTGIYALAIVATTERAHCFAYEPVHGIHEVLKANIALNPQVADRLSTFNVGVSSTFGEATLHEVLNDYGFVSTSSSMQAPVANNLQVRAYQVPIVAIDGESYPAPVKLMKVDVEGHEQSVFAGAKETVAKDRPLIVFEILNKDLGCHFDDFACALDYRFVSFSGSTFHLSRSFSGGESTNYLLCPVEEGVSVFSILKYGASPCPLTQGYSVASRQAAQLE